MERKTINIDQEKKKELIHFVGKERIIESTSSENIPDTAKEWFKELRKDEEERLNRTRNENLKQKKRDVY